MLTKILCENGFNQKEALVYTALLEAGEARIASVATKIKLPRTTVYSVINTMKSRGFVSVAKRKGIEYASVLPPRLLIDRLRTSFNAIEQMLPTMLELAYTSPLKPRVRFYEGIAGLKDILFDMASAGGDVMGITDYEQMPPELYRYIRSTVVPERRQTGTYIRLIAPNNAANLKVQAEDVQNFLGTHIVIEFPNKQRSIEFLLYGKSTIAFLSFTSAEMFGLTIDSMAIYDTLKNMFELLWNAYAIKTE